jgi:hypothetical protein
MDAIRVSEFPFVADLTKREHSRVVDLWRLLRSFARLVEENGPPIRPSLAAELLGVSRARLYVLVDEGRLKVIVSPDGFQAVTANSLIAFAESERVWGRHLGLSTSDVAKATFRSLRLPPEKR